MTNKQVAVLSEADKALYAGGAADEGLEDVYLPTAFLGQPQNELVIDGKFAQGGVYNSLTDETIIAAGANRNFIPLLKWTEYAFNPSAAQKKEGMRFWLTRNAADIVSVPNADGEMVEVTAAASVAWGDAGEKPMADKVLVFLVVFAGDETPVIVKFKRTNFTAGKKLNTLLRMKADPRYFLNTFDMSLVKNKGDQGTWYNYVIAPAGLTAEADVEKLAGVFKNYAGLRDGTLKAATGEEI